MQTVPVCANSRYTEQGICIKDGRRQRHEANGDNSGCRGPRAGPHSALLTTNREASVPRSHREGAAVWVPQAIAGDFASAPSDTETMELMGPDGTRASGQFWGHLTTVGNVFKFPRQVGGGLCYWSFADTEAREMAKQPRMYGIVSPQPPKRLLGGDPISTEPRPAKCAVHTPQTHSFSGTELSAPHYGMLGEQRNLSFHLCKVGILKTMQIGVS